MKARKRSLLAFSMIGAVAFATLPVWAQSGSPSEKQGSGSSAIQGQAGSSEGTKKAAPLRDERTQTGSMGQGQSGSEPGAASRMSRSGGMAGNEDVKKVQQALKDKGQDPGDIDGVMGPKTKEALKAFQEKQGLKATGSLDDQTKKALGIEGGAASGRSSSTKSEKMGTGTGTSTDGRDSVREGAKGKQQ
jgi:peptidoglycan hydrolase-like protein with peptidoglycan-binding domain